MTKLWSYTYDILIESNYNFNIYLARGSRNMEILQNIKPFNVFKYFEEISRIPRGSGNEQGISDYLVSFAKQNGLEVIQDEALNIIIKKPATKGYENAPAVIIQGHTDMVCEKNADTNHDFMKDPLKLVVKDGYVCAEGTTLGADNGIAVAYAMALLVDEEAQHPALEILLTSDEETGMTGAMAINKDHLSGKLLINLDSEEEGYLLVSCAGGIRSESKMKIEWVKNSNSKCYRIKVRGLKGGHSGMDINKQRGNANKIMGRILKSLVGSIEFDLVEINGGSKNNAIPREGDIVLSIAENNIEELVSSINKWNETIQKELEAQDSLVSITIEEAGLPVEVFSKESTKNVIELLYLYPNGVNTMSTVIDDLTESSTNLGIVTTTKDAVIYDSAIRSSIFSLREEIELRVKTITELLGGVFTTNAGYPEWQYRSNSPLREICQKVYKDMIGKDAIIFAIHAGVECGLFKERLGDLDMISFGPDMHDVHTPDERLSIESTEKVWNYLLEVLKNIK